MTKIAMMGQIHQDGWKILEQQNFNVIEIKDFSDENLIIQKTLKDLSDLQTKLDMIYKRWEELENLK